MIKFLYYLRTYLVSMEMLAIVISCSVFYLSEGALAGVIDIKSINEDALKWAALFPISLTIWTFKEATGVIFPDEKSSKLLHQWPDYWKLKAHFNIGIANSVIFVLPCLIVWLLGDLNSTAGVWIFLTFSIANSINTLSFYLAKISIKSILLKSEQT